MVLQPIYSFAQFKQQQIQVEPCECYPYIYLSIYLIKVGTRKNINTNSSHNFYVQCTIQKYQVERRGGEFQIGSERSSHWLYAKWADICTLTTCSLTFQLANEVKENSHIYIDSFLNGPCSVKYASYRFNFWYRLKQSISLFRLTFKKKRHLKFVLSEILAKNIDLIPRILFSSSIKWLK